MKFTDTVLVAGTRLTSDGYLIAEVRCARAGNVQTYLGSEVGLSDRATVGVYRPESAVFDKASLATFAGKPVTMGHPAEPVTAENWRQHAVGDVGGEIVRDGDFVRVPMKLMDAAAIKAVQDGTREISMGYSTEIEIGDGVAPDGTPYQAKQIGPIRINHLAIVPKGRAGSECRIGDAADARWGASPIILDKKDVAMADAVKTRTVLIDGLSVETTDAGAQALEKLTKTIADKDKALSDAQATHDKALAAKDADLAKKDAEIADLKGKVLSDADLDARVQARADLVGKARALVKDFDPAGKSDADIRKDVVIAKRGAAMADKSAAYIDAAFDLLAEDAGKTTQDPIRQRIAAGDTAKVNDEADAWAANLADLNRKPKEG